MSRDMTERQEQDYTDLVRAFHLTWDSFPGAARIIDSFNRNIAVNKFAAASGMKAGEICALRPSPEQHRGCLKRKALLTGAPQFDRTFTGKIRGWLPLEGYPDAVVHFSIAVPEKITGEEKSGSAK